jgi:single-strand DNA-binding protein
VNSATFAGRLGRDAEVRTTGNNNQVTGWSLAVDEYAGQGERRTLWIDCSMWGERGAKLAEYLVKGVPVAVSGQVGVRTYDAHGETKAVITLNVRELTLLGSKADGEGGQRQERQAEKPAERQAAPTARNAPPARNPPPRQQQETQYPDDDIPF